VRHPISEDQSATGYEKSEHQFSLDSRLGIVVGCDGHLEGRIVLGIFRCTNHSFCGKPVTDGMASSAVVDFLRFCDLLPMSITAAQCRAVRGLLGWTQQALADRAWVGTIAINQLENLVCLNHREMSLPMRPLLTQLRHRLPEIYVIHDADFQR
jgi:hypothetical protein